MTGNRNKKIWIDLDNTPHVPLFKPIIEELSNRGYSVLLTARDCFQVCDLAESFKLSYKKIGKHYGKNKAAKLLGLLGRGMQLMPVVRMEKPDLAISAGSRSQLLIAWLLKIPSMVMLDYEYVRGFVRPGWLITPAICPDNAFAHITKRILKYPGLKEDVYVPNFKPDPSMLRNLGINGKNIVVVVRPPATEAHYHNQKSEQLFEATVNHIGRQQGVMMIMLPRNSAQTALIKKMWPDLCAERKIVIPEHAVDGLNLIWYSDLVISGGGTMNREAAALGVPVYSIFRGEIGAVDQGLARENRLTLIENEEELYSRLALTRRHKADYSDCSNNPTLGTIVSYIIGVAEADTHWYRQLSSAKAPKVVSPPGPRGARHEPWPEPAAYFESGRSDAVGVAPSGSFVPGFWSPESASSGKEETLPVRDDQTWRR